MRAKNLWTRVALLLVSVWSATAAAQVCQPCAQAPCGDTCQPSTCNICLMATMAIAAATGLGAAAGAILGNRETGEGNPGPPGPPGPEGPPGVAGPAPGIRGNVNIQVNFENNDLAADLVGLVVQPDSFVKFTDPIGPGDGDSIVCPNAFFGDYTVTLYNPTGPATSDYRVTVDIGALQTVDFTPAAAIGAGEQISIEFTHTPSNNP